MSGKNPLMKRNLGALKESSDSHGKLLTARAAGIEAGAVAFTLKLADRFGLSTVGAIGAIWPSHVL